MRCFLASLMLVAFLLPSAPLRPRALARSCPLGAGASAAIVAMSETGCAHMAQSACLTLACGVASPVISPVAIIVAPSSGLILVPFDPARHLVDSYRTGPPTPPPNNI